MIEVAPTTGHVTPQQVRENAEARRQARAARRGIGPTALDEVEDTWLETITGSLARRMLESGWRADEPGAYCPRCGRGVDHDVGSLGGCGRCRQASEAPRAWEHTVRLGRYAGLLRTGIRELKFHRGRAAGMTLGRLLGEAIAEALRRDASQRAFVRVVLVPVPTTRRRLLSRGIDHTMVVAREAQRALVRDLTSKDGAEGQEYVEVRVASLLRKRHVASQTQLVASQRRRNVAGAFSTRGLVARHEAKGLAGWLQSVRWWASPWRSVVERGAAGGGVAAGVGDVWGVSDRDRQGSRNLRVRKGPADGGAGTLVVVIDDITTTGATLRQATRAVSQGLRRLGLKQARLWAAVLAVTEQDQTDREEG